MRCLGIDTRGPDNAPRLQLLKGSPVVQNGCRVAEYFWKLEKTQRAAGAW